MDILQASQPSSPSTARMTPHRGLALVRESGEVDRRRNVYLATVGHEMRNALAPLSNAIDIVAIRASDVEGFDKLLPVARRQIQLLARLTEDLLDLGRAVNDEFHLTFATECLQPLVRNAVETLRVLAESKHQTISLELPAESVSINADRVRFGQVLQNIIGNAIKFTPDGGRISVRLYVSGSEARICVSDTGIGISLADIGNIFDVFYRARAPGVTPGGLGIGLAVARQLIEAHCGTISVRSEGTGEGASFTIALPIAGQSACST
ncbi:MAG TPA: HAMP domain-containing sensor histidine kinase [Ramlibacter sp.]|nr:HAMP domain-containing sensor histidine kinase [Ramlibacter sp.]